MWSTYDYGKVTMRKMSGESMFDRSPGHEETVLERCDDSKETVRRTGVVHEAGRVNKS